MKKLLVIIGALIALTVYASANGGDYEFCQEHPDSPICGYGGQDGRDGIDGNDGTDGRDGVDGERGERGEDGADGKDGSNGADGRAGVDGSNGTDGKDGVVDYSYVDKTFEYTRDVAAGSMAVSAIDFGTTCKGVTEIGAGIGYADSFNGSSTAGAVGIKHGFTDKTAGIVKAWGAGSDTYAIGAGVTHRF